MGLSLRGGVRPALALWVSGLIWLAGSLDPADAALLDIGNGMVRRKSGVRPAAELWIPFVVWLAGHWAPIRT
jgi:hypothetical protein